MPDALLFPLPEKITCGRCTMTFRVGKPTHRGWAENSGQHFCSEPNCRLPFWCNTTPTHAVVGIYPADAAQWLGIEP